MAAPGKGYARVAKIAFSISLLALILWFTDVRSVLRAMATADIGLVAAASSLFFVGYLLTSLRWRLLLSLRSAPASLAYLIRSFMVASFFNNLLPSSMGGDIVRVYDSWRLGLGKGAAVSTVAMDRALGMLALGVYVLVGLASSEVDIGTAPATVLTIIVLTMTGGFLVLFANRRVIDALSRLTRGRAAARLVDPLLQVLAPFAGQRWLLLRCFVISLLLQGNVIAFYWLSASALGLPVDYLQLALVVPVALVLLMIPITINGIGLREGVFVFLLARYGIDSADAVAFSLLIYLQTVLQGLLGGLVFLFRSEKRFLLTARPGKETAPVER